ncbi:MAG: FtsX-like permease family protein [Anaerolineae bacterium]|nr:FtsX-like permease family protein [Anaerolineae bacterium]
MKRLWYLLSVFTIALQRLWHQRGLVVSMLVGMISAVALTVSIPIYADAISYRVLEEKLSQFTEANAPPFSFLFRYIGSWNGFLEWQDTQKIEQFMAGEAAYTLGLPQDMLVRHYRTDKMRLFPASDAIYSDKEKPLSYISLGFLSDLESHIEIPVGRFPEPLTNAADPLEILIPFALVAEFGIQPGEKYTVFYPEPLDEGQTVQTYFQHTIYISGIWEPLAPNDPYWFYHQSAFNEVLLMPEASYVQIAEEMKGEVGQAVWHLVCGGDAIRSEDVAPLSGHIAVLRNKAAALLADIDLYRSPQEALLAYIQTVQLLTIVLYVISLPILGVVYYFVTLISSMIVQRQRNEIAMLRSRGMTTWQVVTVYLVEGLIVGTVALITGGFLGERFAQLMGWTRSFLVLEYRAFLPTVLSWNTLRFGLIAVGAVVLASVVPAIDAAKATIVTYKQEQARTLRAPFWQRLYLDILLLVPALYGYYILRQRGTISLILGEERPDSPFSNPFLFFIPILFVFGLSLFSIRFFPWVMSILSWLANAWRGVVPILVLRHLSRTIKQYTGPLLLLIFTLSLAIFTASMARTLDEYIATKAYYDVGADFRLLEVGENTQASASFGDSTPVQDDQEGASWLFLPVEEHLSIPGVQAAARVWNRPVQTQLQGNNITAQMMGIDRIDFARVAFFRSDFAPASLGALMNALAVRNDAILVSREIADAGIQVGDKINITLPIGDNPKVDFTVGGVVDYLPRMYPEDGPFFLANLDFIFDVAGGIYPYDVYLKTDPSVSAGALNNEARQLGFDVIHIFDSRHIVDLAQLEPDRQGAFGLLSVGFVVSAFLTVLGFLIYSYVAFLRRYVEFGVLRAVGLSVGQMALSLAAEQFTLILTGTTIGTGLGVLVSQLFIPFLQVQSGEHPFTPPFTVQIAWTEITYIYAVFGAMFLAAVIVLLFFLRRMRIFEAVKMGEAI